MKSHRSAKTNRHTEQAIVLSLIFSCENKGTKKAKWLAQGHTARRGGTAIRSDMPDFKPPQCLLAAGFLPCHRSQPWAKSLLARTCSQTSTILTHDQASFLSLLHTAHTKGQRLTWPYQHYQKKSKVISSGSYREALGSLTTKPCICKIKHQFSIFMEMADLPATNTLKTLSCQVSPVKSLSHDVWPQSHHF